MDHTEHWPGPLCLYGYCFFFRCTEKRAQEHLKSFEESDVVLGVRDMDVISVFQRTDTIYNEGEFREGGSLWYIYDNRLNYSMSTNPSAACRIDSDSSYVRNDTLFAYFTTHDYHYNFNTELYDPEGAYIAFRIPSEGRDLLGWLKIKTNGSNLTIYECAVQEWF